VDFGGGEHFLWKMSCAKKENKKKERKEERKKEICLENQTK